MTDDLTLGAQCPSDMFMQRLSRAFREEAERSQQALGDSPYIARHAQSLRELADYVDGAGLADQRILSLWRIQSFAGGDDGAWVPGEEQGALISRLGLGPSAPSADVTLNELVAAGIDDLSAIRTDTGRKLSAAEAKAGMIEPLTERAEVAEQERDTLRAAAERAEAERDEAVTKVAAVSEAFAQLEKAASRPKVRRRPEGPRTDGPVKAPGPQPQPKAKAPARPKQNPNREKVSK